MYKLVVVCGRVGVVLSQITINDMFLEFLITLGHGCRLLNPDLESSVSLFVGSYILQLILHLPSQMAHHIRDLVAALLRRMQSCEISALKSSLLLIFARLVFLLIYFVCASSVESTFLFSPYKPVDLFPQIFRLNFTLKL